jgi:hypothetical protein
MLLEELVETIAEMIYDAEMERTTTDDWVMWDDLSGDIRDTYLQTAEEIITIINEEVAEEL